MNLTIRMRVNFIQTGYMMILKGRKRGVMRRSGAQMKVKSLSRLLKNSKFSTIMETPNKPRKQLELDRMFKKARSPARSRFCGARSSKAAGSEEAEAYK